MNSDLKNKYNLGGFTVSKLVSSKAMQQGRSHIQPASKIGLAGLAVVFFDRLARLVTTHACAPLRKLRVSKATRPSAVDAYSLVLVGVDALQHLTGHLLRMTLHVARPQLLEARNFITVKQANTNQIPNTLTHARHRLVLCRFSK